MKIDVSVIIPTHNRRHFLEEAITSCFAGNEAVDVEVIVVDDGSTDDTHEFLYSLTNECVRPFFQSHQGAQVARNRGMEEARGWALKFLDDDDYLLPGMLAKQHALLRESGVDVCYGDTRAYRPEKGETAYITDNEECEDFFVGIARGHLKREPRIFLFRREAVEQVRWDEALDYHQDVAFMLDAASEHLTCRKLDEVVAVCRLHQQGRISDQRERVAAKERWNLKGAMHWRAYQRLAERGPLSTVLREAAAEGLWRQAHMLAPFDFRAFVHWGGKALEADPSFCPPRPHAVLEWLDRRVSPIFTERLINPIRKAKLYVDGLAEEAT